MRQRFLRLAALMSVAVIVLAACGSDDGGETPPADDAATSAEPVDISGTTLTVSNWDAYMPKSVVKDFEAETGVTVEYAIHTTNEDIMGKLTAANGTGFDLVFVSGPFIEPLEGLGYAAEIDQSQIPNMANLDTEATELAFDPGNTHSVPYTWGTTGICYRNDLLSETPSSWEAFHTAAPDTEGKMTMLGTDRWLLQPALLSLGYSVNTTDPAEIDEAKAWTMEAKENLLAFDDTTFYSKLVSGEASLVQAWDGWCEYGTPRGPEEHRLRDPRRGQRPLGRHDGRDGSLREQGRCVRVHRLHLAPRGGEAIVEYTFYKMPNAEVMAAVDPAVIKGYPTLAITPAELFEQEVQTDLGEEGTILWTETATEIKA